MNNRRSVQFLICGGLAVLFTGCAMFRDKGQPDIVGSWTNPIGGGWIFRPDGTFDVDLNNDGKRDGWGKYKVDASQIALQRTGGINPKGCNGPGVYMYKREGDKLTFTLMSDRCKLRKKNVLLPWKLKQG